MSHCRLELMFRLFLFLPFLLLFLLLHLLLLLLLLHYSIRWIRNGQF